MPEASSRGTEPASESHGVPCGLRQLSVLPPLGADPGDRVLARQAESLPIQVTSKDLGQVNEFKEVKVTSELGPEEEQ